MKNYRILYYTWNEYTYEDCAEALLSLGMQVDVVSYKIRDYDFDEILTSKIKEYFSQKAFDCIFSFNYFPIISRIADECGVKYISWVFDSPNLTLDSVTLSNECNCVFLFDYCLYQKYRQKGIKTVYHMPLAFNKSRMDNLLKKIKPHYDHEVTFLGSLYDNEYNFMDQIKYLPPKLEGYIDAIIEAQQLIYGFDFCDALFDHNKCEEMAKYVNVDMGEQFVDYRDDLFRNMIRKKITVVERRKIMQLAGNRCNLDLYSPKEPENLPVNYKGYAEYINQMPEIFYTSKINLNITLRSILSGIPLRAIDVLGAHGFLLTNYQPEFSEYFVNGEDLVWYESTEDLLDKIDYYLLHENQRERIAANGNEKAGKCFTYQDLLKKIFSISFGN